MITSQFKVTDMYRNWNFSVSGTNSRDTRACSQCSHPAMIVFCWQCIQQN